MPVNVQPLEQWPEQDPPPIWLRPEEELRAAYEQNKQEGRVRPGTDKVLGWLARDGVHVEPLSSEGNPEPSGEGCERILIRLAIKHRRGQPLTREDKEMGLVAQWAIGQRPSWRPN